MKYVIDKKTYDRHIDDEVHLYGLLHQLAFMANRVKDDEDMETLIETVLRYGEIAEEKFKTWDIPGRYLVFGDKKDLAALREKELERLFTVLKEHDAQKKAADDARRRGHMGWDMDYIISGSSFRLLMGSMFELFAYYVSLARRLTEAKTEKELRRLQKRTAGYEQTIRRLYRGWGVPEKGEVTCHEVLERMVRARHLTPVNFTYTEGKPSPEDFFEDPEEADLFYGIEEPDSDDLLFFGIEDGDD